MLSLIVVMDENRLIGAKNRLPWRLPDDMVWFREQTMGKPMIMGRKTYESIPPKFRPLSGRHNIVVTRNPAFASPGCTVMHSIEAAIAAAGKVDEVVVGGGAQLYAQCLPLVSRIYLTMVNGRFSGDAYFPEFDQSLWCVTYRKQHDTDERHKTPFTWLIMERVAGSE